MRGTFAYGGLLLVTLLLTSADAKGTLYGSPYRYNLHKSGSVPQYYHGKPTGHHKNFCAYVVQKNVTCVMQDGVATYVKPEYTTKCIWGQKCPVLMYRTLFKPQYKIGYKIITELEWRCCPGYSGENCGDGMTSNPDAMMPPFKGSFPRPGLKGYPRGHPNIPVSRLEPGKPFPFPGGHPDNKPIPSGYLPPETPKTSYGPKAGVSGERLDHIEENLCKLSQDLDTLNGMVTGMEGRLRVSLREDTKKMLTTLLGGTPRLLDTSVGFGLIPEGTPNGLDGEENLPGFVELVGRVMVVKDELRAKSDMLDEIRGMVMGHNGQLKKLIDTATGRLIPGDQRHLEELLDSRLTGMRAEVLDGFERRLTGLESHCDERIDQVQQQCHKEHLTGQEQIQISLDGSETGLRKELGEIQAQIQGLTVTESCCGEINSLTQRIFQLEDSITGLTESQRQLQVDLTDQTLHIETRLETRLVGMEGRINASEHRHQDGLGSEFSSLDGFKTLLDDKLKTLERRLFVAVEELSNATAPALLEGQVVPALETEIDSIRRRVEADLDGMQKQMSILELLCTSACSPASSPETALIQTEVEDCKETEKKMLDRLAVHSSKLDHLNSTLQGVLTHLSQQDAEGSIQGEITLLKINVNSVNRTLKGLRDSVSLFAREVGQVNSTWQERENQLVTQVQGISGLVERQASMLGAGERRLIQLKAELQSVRRRLAGELQGCRTTTQGMQQEVSGVESRITQVEGQCGSLGELADDLERIRSELERHSDSFLVQVNGTLVSHSEQLVQLKDGLKDCMSKTDPARLQGDGH
ncbi:EMILIN-3-like [Sinocyclocheilus rhinocerous]|uniref:EMILIN-3-like n=1 Tax=Sinocyclocheilus rhinocerous TaxID=307959 RepID=UPI0007B968B3|nr:PREDICTED: EMILIN-3-like [Sinocyclocheilus rhinocerous]